MWINKSDALSYPFPNATLVIVIVVVSSPNAALRFPVCERTKQPHSWGHRKEEKRKEEEGGKAHRDETSQRVIKFKPGSSKARLVQDSDRDISSYCISSLAGLS